MNDKAFYIFRHGQSTYNRAKRTQGRTNDSVLTSLGRQQAQKVGERLAGKDIEIIVCSPLQRARQTAELANLSLNVPIVMDEAFTEIDVGVVEGWYRQDIISKYAEIYEQWHSTDQKFENVCYPDGETKKQARKRIFDGLKRWAQTDYKNIAVSAHGIMLSQMLVALSGQDLVVENGAVLQINYSNGEWKVVGWL